jgi:hypothetical protein
MHQCPVKSNSQYESLTHGAEDVMGPVTADNTNSQARGIEAVVSPEITKNMNP